MEKRYRCGWGGSPVHSDGSVAIYKATEVIRRAMIDDEIYARYWHDRIASACYRAIDEAKLEESQSLCPIDTYKVANDAAALFMKYNFGIKKIINR